MNDLLKRPLKNPDIKASDSRTSKTHDRGELLDLCTCWETEENLVHAEEADWVNYDNNSVFVRL